MEISLFDHTNHSSSTRIAALQPQKLSFTDTEICEV